MTSRLVAATFALLAAVAPAKAQDLVVGLGLAVSSMDPQFHNTGPNNNIATHVFDRLIHHDPRQREVPGLAVGWKAVDETNWEFTLRRGVRFHDGSEFGADDVLASFRRAPVVPNSPSSFGLYTRSIVEVIKVDDHIVRFRTRAPHPLLPNDVSAINIVSRRHEAATTAEFNAGTAAIGTGPFRFVRYAPNERIVLLRNDAYWGDAPHWAKVEFTFLRNDSARVAALIAGDVQAIEVVPTADMRRLEADPKLAVWTAVSNRLLFLNLDQEREPTPFVTDRGGKPLAKNPLKDVRVRRAISKAINRPALAERMQEGAAIPAGGVIPEGFFGGDPGLKAEAFDLEGARQLLAASGHPDGFDLTIHGPNDRYVNDDKVVQAIAQMLTRAGIRTKVETMPWAVYASRASKPEFSVTFFGWGAATGEASSPLRSLLATFDREKGTGASNRGRYSNPEFDAALAKALATIDDRARERLLREATRLAMADVGIVPLYYQVNVWATRKGLTLAPRADDQTHAGSIRPGG